MSAIEITEDEYHQRNRDYDGYCLSCSEFVEGGCEPDMRKGPCEVCGENKVYGIEELLMMGRITIKEE